MGGLGSGGQNRRNRGYVEQHARLDARVLQRLGAFAECWSGEVSWTDRRGALSSMGIRGGQSRIALDYAREGLDGQAEEVTQVIAVDRVPMPVGGEQPYFLCPCCQGRVLLLLLDREGGRCRKCRNVVYRSTCEHHSDRALRKAFKIRRAMGGETNLLAVCPEKPLDMSWRRYWRARLKLAAAERAFWGAIADEMGIVAR